jgi:hypothetical protein
MATGRTVKPESEKEKAASRWNEGSLPSPHLKKTAE